MEYTVEFSHRFITCKKKLACELAEPKDGSRLEKCHLLCQVIMAGCDFIFQWVAVLRWAAFDDVADVGVAVTAEIDRCQPFVEELTCLSDKWQSLLVFMIAGTFADYHHKGCRAPTSEYYISPCLGQRASVACAA